MLVAMTTDRHTIPGPAIPVAVAPTGVVALPEVGAAVAPAPHPHPPAVIPEAVVVAAEAATSRVFLDQYGIRAILY